MQHNHWSLHMHAGVRMHAAANDSVPCMKRGKHPRWSSKCVCTPNAGRMHLTSVHAGVCGRRARDQHHMPLPCSVQLCLAGCGEPCSMQDQTFVRRRAMQHTERHT